MADVTDRHAATRKGRTERGGAAKRLVNKDGSGWEGSTGVVFEKVDKRRAPPKAGDVQRTFQVTATMMRALLETFVMTKEQPRAAETGRSVDGAIKWLRDRLGPMVDPDYAPPLGKRSFVYRITGADGSVVDYVSAREAAIAYGVSEAGLKSMISRNSAGKCGRFVMYNGEPARVECERMEVVSAPPAAGADTEWVKE